MKSKKQAFRLGQSGESLACTYLSRHNYVILHKGYRFHKGEIDIIALDRDTLVFVEVKTRSLASFGYPEEAINLQKQKQIVRIAKAYIATHNFQDVECRFDVLSISYKRDGRPFFKHIQNAFQAS